MTTIDANPCSEFSKSDKAKPHLNAVSRIMAEISKKWNRVISLLHSVAFYSRIPGPIDACVDVGNTSLFQKYEDNDSWSDPDVEHRLRIPNHAKSVMLEAERRKNYPSRTEAARIDLPNGPTK